MVFGMKTESEAPETMDDFVRQEGALVKFHSNNLQTQTGQQWCDCLRKYVIGSSNSEPNYQQQKDCECLIKYLKQTTVKTMDCSGAPPYLWLMCFIFCCGLLNHVAHSGLDWRTPIEKCYGNILRISANMSFMRRLFFSILNFHSHIPRNAVGVANDYGDKLTY